jgi:diacylglycerol kinase (ATP)
MQRANGPGPSGKAAKETSMPCDRPRAAVVVNPTKVADLAALRGSMTTTMTDAGWDTPLWLETTAQDPGYALTEQALREGVTLVVACGGDGTMRAVLTVLAGSDTPLAVVATGTGNLLARNLGLPLNDPDAALEVALTGTDRRLDVGRVEPTKHNGRAECFAVMAGIGVDAAVMRDAPEKLKATVGWPAYLVSAARHLRGASMRVHIRIDDREPIQARAQTVVIGNVGTLQGGLELLPDAHPDDGVLDVAVIVSHNLRDWLRVASRIVTRRTHVDHRYETYQGKQIRVSLSSAQPRQLDGDLIDNSRLLSVQVEAAALIVRSPTDETTNSSNQGTTPRKDA